ncbi:type VII secretion protein EccB [Kitasatospora sp. NE20-6]|uniref:type VII secretion protein EccB n=1 Tax=Kitasatospora sp. NE20-6 TaxID=2859066 RepID=UPI0034DC5C9A
MQSRRDQVQAHLFVMSRLASGMLRDEPDAPDTPIGRTSRGMMGGLAIAALISLVVAIYGMVVPGGATSWQKPGTLVVVKESGARYLSVGGVLHPVLNEASARLLAGDQLTVEQVSVKSLEEAPRGAPIGIVGAPDGLPEASRLGKAPWLVCAIQQTDLPGRPSRLALMMGPRQEGRALTDDQSVLVATPDGTEYLLWRGRRLRLDDATGRALGYGAVVPFPVSEAFPNTLPAGPDLASPPVDRRGSAGPSLAGLPTRVGQLFAGPAGEHYVLAADGLVPLTATMFELLRGDRRTQQDAYGGSAVTPVLIGPADLADHSVSAAVAARWSDGGLPSTPPSVQSVVRTQAVCTDLRLSATEPVIGVRIADAAAVTGQSPAVQPGVLAACAGADLVAVRPGSGALVRALPGGGAGSTLYLVTDAGVRYPLASAAAAKQLGYGAAAVQSVPDLLLGLLPTGPSLDPDLLSGGGVVGPPPTTRPCAG